MRKGFRIVRFKDWERINELRTLFCTGLGETSEQYWRWKYGSNNGQPDACLLMVENDNGRMVATFGLQPLLYRNKSEEHIVVQLQDLVVHPDFRGSGFVRVLYNAAREHSARHGASAFVAYTNDASFGPFIKFGSIDMGDIGSLRSGTSGLSVFKTAKRRTERYGYVFECSETLPPDIFFSDCDTEFKMVKSAAYMRWRFDLKPDESFQWLCVRKDKALKAWFVFQENRGRIHTAVNIYDYEVAADVPLYVRREAVRCLARRGSWVSLWGRLSDEEKCMWKNIGLTKETKAASHFMLHFFDAATPLNWHILRVDRDF